ncbi:MAG: flagellar motor protein MotB [Nitrospiria bacterium]
MARKKGSGEEGSGGGLMVMMVSLNLILLIFFIYLNSIGANDEQRVKKALGSLAGRFGILQEGLHITKGKEILIPGAPLASRERNQVDMGKAFRALIQEANLEEEVRLSSEGPDLVINLSEKVLFPSGSADLYPDAVPLLGKVAGLIQGSPFPIRVEGHTDDQPIATDRFPSNWELSAARAVAVLRYLIEKQEIPKDRLSAVGLGAHRPLVPNDTPENRGKNRRVNIVLVKGGVEDGEKG